MSVTEHLLTCIKNHVLSDVAKFGGGINLDISTQKNKQIWFCLALVVSTRNRFRNTFDSGLVCDLSWAL